MGAEGPGLENRDLTRLGGGQEEADGEGIAAGDGAESEGRRPFLRPLPIQRATEWRRRRERAPVRALALPGKVTSALPPIRLDRPSDRAASLPRRPGRAAAVSDLYPRVSSPDCPRTGASAHTLTRSRGSLVDDPRGGRRRRILREGVRRDRKNGESPEQTGIE